MNLYHDLHGKISVVTGASRGIGRACARYFSDMGVKVVVHYHQNQLAAEDLLESLSAGGITVRADLSSEEGCAKLINAVESVFGGFHILVINHGIWEKGNIEHLPAANLTKTMDLNLKSCFYLVREAIPVLKKQGGGSIVLISSTAGQRGEPFYSAYAATKAGIIGLTKSWAVELAPFHIRVNAVAPGWVYTDMTKSVFKDKMYEEEIRRSIPLQRIAQPEDIAGPVVFLTSSYARHITGEILNVNGGSVLCG